MAWQILSALFLLAMGGIHLYLALNGVDGLLGVLFILNTLGAVVLAIAMVLLRRQLLLVASVLSVLFTAGTLLALVLALIPGGWRAYWLELLTRCWLALNRRSAAERAAHRAGTTEATVRLPLATAWADRAVAAVALHSGDTTRAIERALASAEAAHQAGAPIESALSRTLAARALALAGELDRAVAQLQRQQQRSRHAARCATVRAQNANSGNSATGPTGVAGPVRRTELASNR
jgi:hypothetical protein